MTNRIIAEQATGPRGISVKLSGYREPPLPCHGKNKQLDPARNFQILDVIPNRAVNESFKLSTRLLVEINHWFLQNRTTRYPCN